MPRFPTAILVTGLMILAFLSFFCGLILDTVVRGRREVRRLAYLALRRSAGPANHAFLGLNLPPISRCWAYQSSEGKPSRHGS